MTTVNKQEYGFYIYLVDGYILRVDPVFKSDPITEESTEVTNMITLSETNEHNPPDLKGAKYAVALFHTHPPLPSPSQSRTPGPSIIDLYNLPQTSMPCIVADYDASFLEGGKLTGGHDINLPWKLYSYSVSQRSIYP